jgi:alkaline phosphatase D
VRVPAADAITEIAPTRRAFLRLAGGAVGLVAAPALVGCVAGSGTTWHNGDPFSLGVASGEPSPDGFVLWTRLAPDPLAADPATPGGMSGGPVTLGYEIATDKAMRDIVQRGAAVAEPRFAYSTHLEIAGLAPGRPYWYRFTSGEAASRIGRAITAPAPGARLDRLRFAFASCSHYEYGYFSAYRHLADEQPDLVLFLGDYIYEFANTRRPTLRRHSDGVTASTLPAYRNRYAQYRTDPDLQRLHAEITALMIWDDHEVQNDYADEWSETFDPPEKFLRRRAAAYQAFYEHMPVRPSRALPNGPAMRLYERFVFGDLAEFSMIDGRQYRSREACYGPPNKGGGHLENAETCPELIDPARSMIGPAQERWLFDGLARSQSRWNVIAQDVLMAQLRETDLEGTQGFWTDNWNGYPASRARLLQHIHDSKVANPVVIGGDIHSFWNNDLKLDFDDPRSPVVATELVGTSITSPGVPYEPFAKFLPQNPHVRFFESRKRGYVMVDLERSRMIARFQTISDVADPKATLSTLRSFTIEDGRAGALV